MRTTFVSLIVFVVIFIIGFSGSQITQAGMDWYDTLRLPSFTPAGSVIGIVWTVIYILSGIATILLYQVRSSFPKQFPVMVVLLVNGAVNLLWTWIFFGLNNLGLAIIEMMILNLITLSLICFSWSRQRLAAMLLIPYFVWVCFATYLAFAIWQLNP